jgi:ATP-dependent Lon protease
MFDNHRMNLQNGDDEVEFLPVLSDDDVEMLKDADIANVLPIVALRNTVLFPGVVLPITVGRDKSIAAVNEAYKKDKIIGIISQKDPNEEEANPDGLHRVGTIAKILKRLKMPDGSTTVIIQGNRRFALGEMVQEEPFFIGNITPLNDVKATDEKGFNALISSIKDLSKQIIKSSPNIPTEAATILNNINNPTFLIHFVISNLNIDLAKKQAILEINELYERANTCYTLLNEEMQLLELKNQIQDKVKGDLDKQQRDYFLSQQMRIIQEELGGDSVSKEVKRLREKSESAKLTAHAKEAFDKELAKLERTNPAAAEYGVILNYLDLLLELPWGEYTKDKFDLKKTKEILDKDHFGLDKVKERILEYLAVLKLKGDFKSPILCLVGPPGVGKTSLGKSIADSIDRKYVRMALGGLHDESEIRGHRKTYIGAMPGRIVQSLKKAKSSNPVFILDEIDKIGNDFRGDPASALLEVLDPEQNANFYDNYLELDYDLSKVMFIATANSLAGIHPALRDRMEIIQIDGYSTEEKLEIAQNYLVPKQRKAHGLKLKDIKVGKKTLNQIIDEYTRESGVRELDRVLASVMRYAAKHIVMEEAYEEDVKCEDLYTVLGAAKYDRNLYNEKTPSGVAVGLAYTSVGGDILYIETSKYKGKGALILTGKLGDVMKESASTALTFIKSNAAKLKIDTKLFEENDFHLHVPEGAVPKDGPSAGITILSALTSLLLDKPIKSHLAMTGEITLRGKVLPVGGIKEKILAAKRSGMKEIVMSTMNRKDVEEIKEEYIKSLKFHYVDRMEEVLKIVLA